jgi:hypothetical protein
MLHCMMMLMMAIQDDRYIYFVIELLLGGELFMHLRKAGQFTEPDARFYAARYAAHTNTAIYTDDATTCSSM